MAFCIMNQKDYESLLKAEDGSMRDVQLVLGFLEETVPFYAYLKGVSTPYLHYQLLVFSNAGVPIPVHPQELAIKHDLTGMLENQELEEGLELEAGEDDVND